MNESNETIKRYSNDQGCEVLEFFESYPWQWMFSGNTEEDARLTHSQVEEKFALWRSIACRVTGLQIGAVGATVNYHGRHCHAMLLGSNRTGDTLLDVDEGTRKQLERLWFALAQNTGKISVCRDTNLPGYVVFKNLVGRNAEIIAPQGRSVLKKFK